VRAYPGQPIVGVGAVVLDGDRVLLVRRLHPPLQGEWSLPGGAVELGETLETAVAREVLEETGLRVAVGPVAGVVNRVHRDTQGRVEYHYVVVDYCCRPSGGTLACASDAADAMWVPVNDLSKYRLTDAAVRIIDKALELARSSSYPT
jgi:ADP-ribose pyrophosphatase YjhB (NUDIX family)